MSKKITWKDEIRKVKDLIPADYNPRSLSAKQRADLLESVEEFGRVVPLIVNIGKRKNVLIGGHQRTTIYADLGIEEIEVRVPSRELTEEEEKKLNLRLNKNTGSWDTEKLGTLDMELLLDVGFGDEELSSLWDNVDIIDEQSGGRGGIKKEEVIPTIAPGEIVQLGNHRLMCGDATDHTHVAELMKKDKADMLYMDPDNNQEYRATIEQSLDNALNHSKKDIHVFYWTDQTIINTIQNLYNENKIENKRVCLWIKSQSTPKPKIAFNRSYEPCVYGTRGKPYLNNNTKKLNEILNKDIESDNQGYDQLLEYFSLWLQDKKEEERRYHPQQKPLSIQERPLKRCTAPGHIVMDLFGGSGSTLIVSEQLGRKARIMEIDPVQATIIIDRWEEKTGQKAKKLS